MGPEPSLFRRFPSLCGTAVATTTNPRKCKAEEEEEPSPAAKKAAAAYIAFGALRPPKRIREKEPEDL